MKLKARFFFVIIIYVLSVDIINGQNIYRLACKPPIETYYVINTLKLYPDSSFELSYCNYRSKNSFKQGIVDFPVNLKGSYILKGDTLVLDARDNIDESHAGIYYFKKKKNKVFDITAFVRQKVREEYQKGIKLYPWRRVR